MQDYIDFARKNNVILLDEGYCQFCGAHTTKGVHECLEIFNLGFSALNFENTENHLFKFLVVDAHTLQHSEIHGRWNNHFHLSRLHLVLHYGVNWTYNYSPLLSNYLKVYKSKNPDEFLPPPQIKKRGKITTTEVLKKSVSEDECKKIVMEWAISVYESWNIHISVVDKIGAEFLGLNPKIVRL